MKTITVLSEIGSDGTLRLEIPCDLPPGPVEVVVVVNPTPVATPSDVDAQERAARSGLFVGKGSHALNLDTRCDAMNACWKAKLADLEP